MGLVDWFKKLLDRKKNWDQSNRIKKTEKYEEQIESLKLEETQLKRFVEAKQTRQELKQNIKELKTKLRPVHNQMGGVESGGMNSMDKLIQDMESMDERMGLKKQKEPEDKISAMDKLLLDMESIDEKMGLK